MLWIQATKSLPATTPPLAEVKPLTKKLSPPKLRLRPFMKPPCVDVAMLTSPRVIAIAPASARTLSPAGKVIRSVMGT